MKLPPPPSEFAVVVWMVRQLRRIHAMRPTSAQAADIEALIVALQTHYLVK